MQAIAQKRTTYDIPVLERKSTATKDAAKERTAAKASSRAKAKSSVSGFALFCAVLVFVTLVVLLYSYVNLTEASDINHRRQVELSNLREEVQMLEVSRNQRMGALQVRDWAVTKLGMSKIDKAQITYVSTTGGDRFEIGEKKEHHSPKLVAGLVKGFSTVIEYIN